MSEPNGHIVNPETECGFGYQDTCCCLCDYLLLAKPRCHHIGGKGKCGASEGVELPPARYVCTVFAHEGVAMTDWDRHGCCEGFQPKGEREGFPLTPEKESKVTCIDCNGEWCVWCLVHHGHKDCPLGGAK